MNIKVKGFHGPNTYYSKDKMKIDYSLFGKKGGSKKYQYMDDTAIIYNRKVKYRREIEASTNIKLTHIW